MYGRFQERSRKRLSRLHRRLRREVIAIKTIEINGVTYADASEVYKKLEELNEEKKLVEKKGALLDVAMNYTLPFDDELKGDLDYFFQDVELKSKDSLVYIFKRYYRNKVVETKTRAWYENKFAELTQQISRARQQETRLKNENFTKRCVDNGLVDTLKNLKKYVDMVDFDSIDKKGGE